MKGKDITLEGVRPEIISTFNEVLEKGFNGDVVEALEYIFDDFFSQKEDFVDDIRILKEKVANLEKQVFADSTVNTKRTFSGRVIKIRGKK